MTALSSVADEHAGLASAVNNDVARVGGLVAVAVIPPLAGISGTVYLHPGELAASFHTAVFISASLCVLGGILAAVGIRNPEREPRPDRAATSGTETLPVFHCALDAPALVADEHQ
jgi:hypothetical protein